jgi:hypothetical protein
MYRREREGRLLKREALDSFAQPGRDVAPFSAVRTRLSDQSWQTSPPVRRHPPLQCSKRDAGAIGNGAKLSTILEMRLKKPEALKRAFPFVL